MEAFINGMACISHHPTGDPGFFFEDLPYTAGSNFLLASAIPYKDHIPVSMIRRTSHILKMGISAGLMCLQNAGIEKPDAIIVGTAMGCFEDTDKFLRSLLDNNEQMLTPTSFIQSTHNTLAGQLALLIKSHGYNFTYTHQNLSFEYALLDGLMLLQEKEAANVLVGGTDELIKPLCDLFELAGHIKSAGNLDAPIWKSKTSGYIAGEGAAFFNLGTEQGPASIAKLRGVRTFQQITDKNALTQQVNLFLNQLGLMSHDISLVLSGASGDVTTDATIHAFTRETGLPVAYFKHLCGEYFTCSAFALWLGASILKKQRIPSCMNDAETLPESIQHLLIVNQYQNQHYSLMCLSLC